MDGIKKNSILISQAAKKLQARKFLQNWLSEKVPGYNFKQLFYTFKTLLS